MSRIRVLIADDHALFREGLVQILEIAGDFEIVGNAENGQVAIDLARRLKPDVVLMDINMPVVNGIEATGIITRACPETRVIMLTIYRQDRYLFDAIKAGARGYLLKDVDGQQFIAAVRAVARGDARRRTRRCAPSHAAMRSLIRGSRPRSWKSFAVSANPRARIRRRSS